MEEIIRFLGLKGKNLLIILDYDGTLTEIVNDPLEAKLSETRKKILEDLSNKTEVTLVISSGRSIEELLLVTNDIQIDLLGNHGLFYRENSSNDYITTVDQKDLDIWDHEMLEMREYLKESVIPKYNRLWLQENKHGFVLHTRLMEKEDKNTFLLEINGLLKNKFKDISHSIGKEIIEIKPSKIINKGKGIEWYLKNKFIGHTEINSRIITAGDDVTDEDMFNYVNKLKNGISIKIDDSKSQKSVYKTSARVIFRSITEFYEFLNELNKQI